MKASRKAAMMRSTSMILAGATSQPCPRWDWRKTISVCQPPKIDKFTFTFTVGVAQSNVCSTLWFTRSHSVGMLMPAAEARMVLRLLQSRLSTTSWCVHLVLLLLQPNVLCVLWPSNPPHAGRACALIRQQQDNTIFNLGSKLRIFAYPYCYNIFGQIVKFSLWT